MQQSELDEYQSDGSGDVWWQNREELERMYVKERMTLREIGERVGRSLATVHYWFNKLDITRRDFTENQILAVSMRPVPLQVRRGYERWRHTHRGESEHVSVHRLLAVAEFGFEAVKGMDVHHGVDSHLPAAEIPWANWAGNIELRPRGDHSSHHNPRRFSAHEAEEIRNRYAKGDVTQKKLAEQYNVSQPLIAKVIHQYGRY